jgi:O-antigen/teichoic acid export membrane protein
MLTAIASVRTFLLDLRLATRSITQFSRVAAERGAERNRRVALAGVTAAAARVVQIGASLITVPLALRYLGTERFGLWMTISSVLLMAGFADFGLGNGLLNAVAKAHGKDDIEGIKKAISSGFASLCCIAGVILILFLSIYRFVSWADLFRVTSPTARLEAGPTLMTFAICFALNLPSGAIQRTQLALQEGFLTDLWQLLGSVMTLLSLLLGIWLRVGLPVLVLAIAGAPVLATALNGIFFFGIRRPDLRPRWRLASLQTVKQIMSVGVLFFVLQVVGSLAFSADGFVVARTTGAVNVPEYVIPQRMFSLITMAITMFLTPLWPAYAEAKSRGDGAWVKHTLYKSMTIALSISGVAAVGLLIVSRGLIHWWAGPTINPPMVLLAGLAVWTVMDSCGNALAAFLNGSGFLRPQIFVAATFGISCIAAKVYLARRFGSEGLPWATIFTWGLINFIPLMLYARSKLQQMTGSKSDSGAMHS